MELLSNQCYAYDFSDYIGHIITISFLGKLSENNCDIYLQKGKSIGENLERVEGITKDGYKAYEKTLTITDDVFRILFSSNCFKSWYRRRNICIFV